MRLVYGLMQSLHGYVSGPEGGPGLGAPGEELFRHFIEQLRGVAGCLYGRRIYEVMRYWDEDRPDYSDIEHEFGEVWRSKPKWVASHILESLGNLIDEYRLYLQPVALGGGKPFFAGARSDLRLSGVDRIGQDTVRLTYEVDQ